jgi:hypothetical protein
VDRTARDQAAHAVTDQHDLFQRHRPGRQHLVQAVGQLQAIAGDVQAGVVVQIKRREAAFGRQRGAMVVAIAAPLLGVHAQAVHQHQQTGAGLGQRLRQGAWFEHQRLPVVPHVHVDRERVGRGLEVIAQHTVEGGQHGLALDRDWPLAGPEQMDHLAQQGVEAAAHQPRHPANAAVDQAGDAAGGPLAHRAQRARGAQDVVVQVLDQIGQAERGVHRQAARATQVGGAHMGFAVAARRGHLACQPCLGTGAEMRLGSIDTSTPSRRKRWW